MQSSVAWLVQWVKILAASCDLCALCELDYVVVHSARWLTFILYATTYYLKRNTATHKSIQ